MAACTQGGQIRWCRWFSHLHRLVRCQLLLAVLAHPGLGFAEDNYYSGVTYSMIKSETYDSIIGGRVTLLQPAGFDYFPHDWAPWAVLVEGELSPETAGVLKRLVEANAKVSAVYLDSPGGDLFAGMMIGSIIKDHSLDTLVNWNSECESACALAFLAGTHRVMLGPNSRFGFHRQYYIQHEQIVYGSWAKDIAQINTYFKLLGVSQISAAEVVGTTQLITYSDDRLKERGFTTQSRNDVVAAANQSINESGVAPSELYSAACASNRTYHCLVDPQRSPAFRQPQIIDFLPEHFAKVMKAIDVTFHWDDLPSMNKMFAKGVESTMPEIKDSNDFFKLDCESFGANNFRTYINSRLGALRPLLPNETFSQYIESARELVSSCSSLIKSDKSPIHKPNCEDQNTPEQCSRLTSEGMGNY